MKYGLGLMVLLIWGTACAKAQTGVTVAQEIESIRISDTEAVGIAQTIDGYMQGAANRGRIELFDRKKGQIVTLRLDRIVADDPERIAFPQPNVVAVCGECAEVVQGKDSKGKSTEQETGDKYDVWFLVKRGDTVASRVLDVVIKSVNGKPMYNWTKDASGKWSATLAPDAP